MDRTVVRTGLVAATALLLASGAVQVLDPGSRPDGPTRVDLTEPPGEVAADSLRVLHNVNHTEHVVTMSPNRTSGEIEANARIRFRYEPADRQYTVSDTYNGPMPETPETYAFGEENTAWGNAPATGRWVEVPHHRFTDREPFDPSALDNTSVRIAQENRTTLVIIVEGEPANAATRNTIVYGASERGRLTLYVDKDTRRLDRALYRVRTERGDPNKHVVFSFEEYGSSDVERPEGVPVLSVRAFVWDVGNGPLFRVEPVYESLKGLLFRLSS